MENATTVFLVLSFDFETCPRLNRLLFKERRGGKISRDVSMFLSLRSNIYIYILEIVCVLGEKKEAGND